jgi:hypothetical protein
MFAIDYTLANPGINATSPPFNITAYTENIQGGGGSSRQTNLTYFQLESCTPTHFSRIPSVKQKFT